MGVCGGVCVLLVCNSTSHAQTVLVLSMCTKSATCLDEATL